VRYTRTRVSPDADTPSSSTTDLHHKVQLGLLRAMEHHLVCESDPAAAADTLAQLLAFTRVHFEAEELLMRHHRYPGVAAHASAHLRLLGEALAVGQAHGAGDAGSARATVARLRAWLVEHIEGEDAAFDRWCAKSGVALE